MPWEVCLTISILILIPRNLFNATLTGVTYFFFFSDSIKVPNAMKLNNRWRDCISRISREHRAWTSCLFEDLFEETPSV